jgi:DNA-binding beta-propeller fold protein YncE
MNKRITSIIITILIILFAGYMVIDVALKEKVKPDVPGTELNEGPGDKWTVKNIFTPLLGQLNAVAVTNSSIIIAGEPYIASYDTSFNLNWKYTTQMSVTALATYHDKIYAATGGVIIVLDNKGEKIEEWGPFESNSMITSLSANENYVAVADAVNKMVLILDKKGVVKKLIGQDDGQFIIPSPYFDVVLDYENTLYVANTGQKRIESRSIEGKLLNYFGESGIGPEAFCGCCNPSHFILIPEGFVTSEKGINRIKILNGSGGFVEYVSSVNKFMASVPLDLASSDGKIIYAANPADSKLYIFTRINSNETQ